MSADRKPAKMISYAKYGYIFIAPFFLAYAFFMIYPLINTFILSFQGNASTVGTGVGFQNYKDILFGDSANPFSAAQGHHEQFFSSFGNTMILWAGNFVLQLVLSLLLAVWFSDTRIKTKGTGFFKVVMYLPNIVTAATVAGIFLMLFARNNYGFVNSLLMNMGLIHEPIKFTTDPVASKVLVMFIQTWMWYGNTMLLLLSGIYGIDPSIYEAADIDGSSGASTFFRITMPILKPIFLYVFITSMIGGLQMFDIPYLLKDGSEVNVHIRTTSVYIYNNFFGTSQNYGYAGAASVLMFIITTILGLIVYRFNTDSTGPKKKKKK